MIVVVVVYFSSSPSPISAVRFAAARSCLRSRAALVLARLASISSFNSRSRCFSALARWICDRGTRQSHLLPLRITAIQTWMCMTYVLNQRALVLERVTLGKVVQLVVEVLVDLAALTVFDQKAAEDSETAHPQNLATPQSQHPPSLPQFYSAIADGGGDVKRTSAYGHRRYPFSCPFLGVGQFGGQGSAREHALSSAWWRAS